MKRFFLALALLPVVGAAQRSLAPILEPTTYVSPSGKYKLWVNPSHPYGKGKGFCRLTRDGKIVWSKELPFTFYEAKVTDDGTVGGFAYTKGYDDLGILRVAAFLPDGKLCVDEALPRYETLVMHDSAKPEVHDFRLDRENDRMVVLLHGGSGDNLRIYRISDGKRLRDVLADKLVDREYTHVESAFPVRGTSYLVLRMDTYGERWGSAYALLDQEYKPIWRWEVLDDFDITQKLEDKEKLRREVTEAGAVRSSKPGQFEIRLAAKKQWVTYQVTGKDVKEIGRRAHVALVPIKVVEKLVAPKKDFKVVRTFQIPLRKTVQAAIHDVGEFHILPSGQFVYLQQNPRFEICLADVSGKVVRRVSAPKGSDDNYASLAWTGKTSFVLVANKKGWRIDMATGKVSLLPKFKTFRGGKAAGYPDGSFVVLSTEDQTYSSSAHVTLYDVEGRQKWDIAEGGYSGDPAELLSPEDVAVDGAGNVVALDVISHKLQLFDRKGKFLRAIDLDKKWGRQASYPTQVTCLPNRGFLVYDFDAEKPCLVLGASGGIVRSYRPSFRDGKKLETREDMRMDRQGRIWITNTNSLLRLDERGVVAQTLGAAPPAKGLRQVADLYVSPEGKTYAQDGANFSVSVFDRGGRALFVAKPLPTDFDDQPMFRGLDITRSGDIYLSGGTGPGDLHFSPSGRRTGYQPYRSFWAEDVVGPEGPFTMQPSWRWSGSDLIDGSRKVRATLRRWPDQGWMLGGPDAISPDGKMMSYERESEWYRKSNSMRRLAFFDAHGRSIRQTSLPKGLKASDHVMRDIGSAAFDGRLAYFVVKEGLVAVDMYGKALWIYRPVGWTEEWLVFPSLGGIALYDGVRTVTWIEP